MSNMLASTSINIESAMDVEEMQSFRFSEEPSLEKIREMQSEFSKERDWDQFHQPRNLVLAMVGEVGEVAELFQWKGEVKEGLPDWSPKEKQHLSQELSDVLIYLVRLAEKCHIDLPKEVVAKMALNSMKYPAHLVKGSSKKYTEYKEMNS
ncbi:dCTP pyrophosphatase 1-like [Montipora foliosa]|uniref:dCTP pyrophosphatase 1-like n=1 Tax=Montipora foliosa TaxID=591990 RepID=UPI0035F164CC